MINLNQTSTAQGIPLGGTSQRRVDGYSLQGGGSGISLQGSSPSLQVTHNPQPAATNQQAGLQVTANPMNYISNPAPQQQQQQNNQPTAEQLEAQRRAAEEAARRAAEEAKRGQYRGNILDYIRQAKSIYDILFGNIDAIGTERRGQIEEDYGQRRGDLTTDFKKQIPRIQMGFAGLGIGDSTFEDRRLGDAKEGLERGVRDTNKLEGQDLAALGSFITGQRSANQADLENLVRIEKRVPEVEDIGKLEQYEDLVANQLGKLKVARDTTQTQGSLRKQALARTKGISAFGNIRTALQNVLNSAVPGGVKQQVGNALLDAAGLTDDERQRLLADIQADSGLADEQELV